MLFFILDLLTLGAINAIMAVGLNLQYGQAGILNFTYYTFIAIGAYVAAVTTLGKSPLTGGAEQYILQWRLPWPVALLLAGVVAGLLGLVVVLVVVRRLRSDYLAIVTVCIGFIIWNVITNYIPLFNGSNGLFAVPYILNGATVTPIQYTLEVLVVSLVVLAACLWVVRSIFRSPYGRVLRAIREDDVVAASFGKPTTSSRVWVFVIGCFMAGLAGALLVFYISAWNPAAFLPQESFILMAAIVIGGPGNYWGAVLGTFIFIEFLSEIERYLPNIGNGAAVGAGRAILIGIFLIAVVRYRPEGLVPERWLRWYKPSGAHPAGPSGSDPLPPEAGGAGRRRLLGWAGLRGKG